MAGSKVDISDPRWPLKAAISEVDRLTEKFQVISTRSSDVTVDSGISSTKIGFKDSGEELISCLSVMRRLMEEAENENRQLKQEKVLISSKIGDALGAVNREVEHLRIELQKQDKRLVELNNQTTVVQSNESCHISETSKEMVYLKEEKQRLLAENEVLNIRYHELCEKTKNLEILREQVHTYKEDISRANETINCINSERRRLKSEKHDLVGQLREAYCIIEDKENELREFITTYEERMRGYETRIAVYCKDKCAWENERKILCNNAPTQISILKRQLSDKETQMKEMEIELIHVKGQLNRLQETLKVSAWDDATNATTAATTTTTTTTTQVRSEDLLHITNTSQGTSVIDSSQQQEAELGESMTSDDLVLSNPEIYVNHSVETVDLTYYKKRKRYSRLSRVFSRGKSKKSERPDHRPLSCQSSDGGSSSDSSDLGQIWQANKTLPIIYWNSSMVLAFLHVYLQMPMYTTRCAENVKNGKDLADMNDNDLTKALGIISYLHRRKIRLAIEDLRHPASMKYPKIGEIDHHFVAHDWLAHIGLEQYTFTFETQMIDGRILCSMTRKDIEKYLNITNKLRQDSILYGVELLKIINFDREVLVKRKERCEDYNRDPLIWSNERLIRWCDSIKLKDYSYHLRSSGIYGALLVLNPNFGPEELCLCLGIPKEEASLRKHLTSELSCLMINARSTLKLREEKRSSFRNRSKSFNRHSFRRGNASGYDLVDSNSNETDINQGPVVTGNVQRTSTSAADAVTNRKTVVIRRSATLERPKSGDSERHLID